MAQAALPIAITRILDQCPVRIWAASSKSSKISIFAPSELKKRLTAK